MPSYTCAGDGLKAVAKRKLQQAKLPFSQPQQQQPAEQQAEISGSNEPDVASPAVLPKVMIDHCFVLLPGLTCPPYAALSASCLHMVKGPFPSLGGSS